MLPLFDRTEQFESLIEKVQGCNACADMAGCTRVLSWSNGRPDARVMFVGEAPGRLGADRTAVPFHGDKAGDNFERLIALAGLRRSEIFVTNAVLCNPRDADGNNAPPSRRNLISCAANLSEQIALVNPAIVVTLGTAALESTRLIETHELRLSTDVRTRNDWYGRALVPLYHPGARAMIHRNFALQTADYYFIGEQVRRLNAPKRSKRSPKSAGYAWDIVQYIVSQLREVSLFRLHKALYLIDLRSKEQQGESLTGFLYIRQKDGPYCVELGGGWHRQFEDIRFKVTRGKPHIVWQSSTSLESQPMIDASDRDRVDQLLHSIENLTDDQLKSKVYLTKSMRGVLAAEKAGLSQLNRPLL
jgi:uracil-DNA glycosylase family 4